MAAEPIHTFSTPAMNTRFEVALWGRDRIYLETAAEEALAEIRRLEAQLSMFREESEIFELNARAAKRPVPVDPRLFQLLLRARALTAESGGAFDITMTPLLRAWGFVGASGRMAGHNEVEAAREIVGMDLVELIESECAVRYVREGVTIDLGAIGKGYAIEEAAGILRDLEIPGALIHGGTSTVHAVGTRPEGDAWPVAIYNPAGPDHLAVLALQDLSLSVSAVHGKSFTEGDRVYGHVLDPHIGAPANNAILAAVVCPSATESDALSTALLVRGAPFLEHLSSRPQTCALVATGDATNLQISRLGIS